MGKSAGLQVSGVELFLANLTENYCEHFGQLRLSAWSKVTLPRGNTSVARNVMTDPGKNVSQTVTDSAHFSLAILV